MDYLVHSKYDPAHYHRIADDGAEESVKAAQKGGRLSRIPDFHEFRVRDNIGPAPQAGKEIDADRRPDGAAPPVPVPLQAFGPYNF